MKFLRLIPLLCTLLPLTAHAAAPPVAPRSLRVSPAAFAPAKVTRDTSVPTHALDTGTFFARLHIRTYAALGRESGYYQAAGWIPSGQAPVIFRYLTSTYPNVLAAAAAFSDAASAFGSRVGADLQACPSATHLPSPCSGLAVRFKGGQVLFFREVLIGRCVAEITASVASAAEAQSNKNQISAISDDVSRAGASAMTSVCGKTEEGHVTLSVNKVVMVKTSGKKSLVTRSVALNQSAVILAYYRMTGIAVPDALLIFRRGTKAVAAVSMHLVVPPTGPTYFTSTVRFTDRTLVGKLTAEVLMRAGRIETSRAVSLTVTR